MTPRFICPHCHSPIDPLTLEVAVSAEAQYRICPECDEPIIWSISSEDDGDALPEPFAGELSPVFSAGSCSL